MNILILSCNTGGGHNVAAGAIAEYAKSNGHKVEVVDYLSFYNAKINHGICDSYVGVARNAPAFFGMFYYFGKMVNTLLPKKAKSLLYYLSRRGGKKLAEYLAEHPTDCIISTHFLASEGIRWMKDHAKGSVPMAVSVATDYTCVPFFDEGKSDYYVVPHEDLIPEFVRHRVPEDKILPFGIPVSQKFSSLPDHMIAKRELGLPADRTTYLLMSGSMGAGCLKKLISYLLPQIGEDYLVIVCGNNEKLAKAAEKKVGESMNVRILRFSQDIPLYFSGCDLLCTKPGGLTSTEAATVSIPMVHTSPIPGCESSNMRFFASHGMSLTAKGAKKQANIGVMLAKDAEKMQEMRKAQQKNAKPDSAERLVRFLEQKVGESDQKASSKETVAIL